MYHAVSLCCYSYSKLHPSAEPAGEEVWQNEMETMENVRLVLHMQKTLLTELRYHAPPTATHSNGCLRPTEPCQLVLVVELVALSQQQQPLVQVVTSYQPWRADSIIIYLR